MPRNNMNEDIIEMISLNDHFNICDVLLFDHKYLKECIDVLKDESEDKKVKHKYAKGFLAALKMHSLAEKKAVYTPLKEVKNLRSNILESEIEHGIADAKVKMLIPKIGSVRSLSEEIEAEMKVLAEIVEHHIEEEEDDLIPKMRKIFDKTILNEIGYQFVILRQFTDKDLQESPELKEESSFLKESTPIPNSLFLNRTQEHFQSQNLH